ncbi:GNAT family N-acetyltransferase [Eggerthella timonensis]|uniref:GNAT family N-acetyltransferase n=1 Tax=Eggerthella timonensis TaxID=1871008 RepID=UPI000C767C8C|nr:GNAT family N-acetyltransferase [Eggerthella timonensis]
MEHHYEIEHKGILLRPLQHGDIESLRLWRNDAENSQYIRKIPFITSEAQEAWFAAEMRDPATLTFAICADSELVGSVAFYDIHEGAAEFGRLMVGSAKGKGIGFRATEASMRFAFEVLQLVSIQARVSVDNIAALIIYIRIGFCVKSREYNPQAQMDEFELSLTNDRFFRLTA